MGQISRGRAAVTIPGGVNVALGDHRGGWCWTWWFLRSLGTCSGVAGAELGDFWGFSQRHCLQVMPVGMSPGFPLENPRISLPMDFLAPCGPCQAGPRSCLCCWAQCSLSELISWIKIPLDVLLSLGEFPSRGRRIQNLSAKRFWLSALLQSQ